MATTHQVVIIGASYGGIPAAHGLLKKVLPQLSTKTKQTYKVVMISPSDEFWWKVGSPRTIVNPSKLPIEKTLVKIADGFKNYSPEQYQFIKAAVTATDPATKTLTLNNGESVHYDSLVIASGTRFESPIWSVSAGSEATRAALADVHQRLPNAQSVVVAGGGAAGTETAGELGETYGKKKEITFLTGQAQPLSKLQNKGVGKGAQTMLEKYGVQVVNGVKVTSVTKEGGKERLSLSNGETMVVDLYIEATGDRPNNSFVPKEWLNDKGFVLTDGQTLRLKVPDTLGVYCIGSVGSYSDGSILDTNFAFPALLESMRLDLEGQQPGNRTKKVYKKITSDMQFVPIGSTQGVGVVFGYRIPSFMVKMAKSKDFMIGNCPKLINGDV